MQAAVSRRFSNGGFVSAPRAAQRSLAESAVFVAPSRIANLRLVVDSPMGVMPADRSELASRIVNIVVASTVLVLALPLFAIVALLIKLTSKGPVFYSQIRVGVDRRFRQNYSDDRRVVDHGGKLFRMFKFRTMTVDAEPDGKAVWAKKEDPRVTSIGKIMRSTRIDELPQLWNVIRGDMNIVGPRPERPTIFAELRKDIPEYPMRQRVKPGMTGWAQINQQYDACIDDVRSKVQYDLEYMRRQNILEDLKIMSLTVPVMLLRRGGW
jgi:lipopolysaccharide/colanic/teichoic acid biosynthesis glycosyltransferase